MSNQAGRFKIIASHFAWCLALNEMPLVLFFLILILGAWYTERLGQVLVCCEAGYAAYLQKCEGITEIHMSTIKSTLKNYETKEKCLMSSSLCQSFN